MSMMLARAIGVMHMEDQGLRDDKIIAVHVHDPAFEEYIDIDDLPRHTMREIQRFFQDYKTLEAKSVKVEEMGGAEEAKRVVREALELYQKEEEHLRGWK
ncbi:MAG: inorganic diphosphatase [Sandaracinaceae bacterium]|nr:inorganic diphosphatase [Sandaracinaceae bacterium]